MKFYRFDKYIINNGISLRKNYIYDKRIDELIKLDNEDFYIIKCIFKNTKISEILKNENIDIDMLKVWLEYLYNNDILILNRCFYKKTIYMSNYKYMFFKAITIFIIRFLLSIIQEFL